MTPEAPVPSRPLRRDAVENRDRLLAAANQVFDEQGLDASVAEVARVAGVGMGTLYRRFPTKDALIDALVHQILDITIEMATQAATEPDGTGLERFLELSSAYQAQHPGCLPRLWNTDHAMVRKARRRIADLLAEAQHHGRIRPDLTNTDLTLVMFSIRAIVATTRMHAPDAWRRHLDLLIAGMRPGPGELGHPPLSQADLDRILTRA
ncbi:TetR/AcrR family transcriptional regulator [Acidiferrimicrobium sp. IK]|uniref:TetR/AcrR family transcriptional regulator n=1 Tax=Acidiferrimicrobium sp. IK TaxID=2871700 RepID=UPI0021CB8E0F|nr:TetR/AcrR family transcriptional regulator [Acidiferrimicrobium sp. IK]MCU4183354.1 TetR/AcrR family transcriptional regulator [Acidiferrimicrobium sp. IK]